MSKITVFPARKVILPGLIYPHTYFTMSAGYLMQHDIGPIELSSPHGMNPALLTHDQVVAKLRAAHATDAIESRKLSRKFEACKAH